MNAPLQEIAGTELYAPDPMGEAADLALLMISGIDTQLAFARSPRLSRRDRARALVKVFRAWPGICRAFAALQATAPTSAEAGLADDAALQDFLERRLEQLGAR